MVAAHIVHYAGIALGVALSSGGVAIGQGLAGGGGLDAMSRQRLGHGPVQRALLLCLVLIESGGIFALITGIMFMLVDPATITWAMALGTMGANLCIGIAACSVGWALGKVAQGATEALSRQPLHHTKIISLMIMTQIFLEAPSVFAFIIALLIRARVSLSLSLMEGWQMLFVGLLVGLGTIGPAAGQALFSRETCRAVGRNISMYDRIFSYALITQGMVEAPVIFCLIMGLFIFATTIVQTPLGEAIAALSGVVSVFSLSAVGAAVGNGLAGASAVRCMAESPAQHPNLFRLALLAQSIIETAVVYSLIVGFLLFARCV